LPKLLTSLEQQTIKPIAWYIFDDRPKRTFYGLYSSKFKIIILKPKQNKEWYYLRLSKNLNYLVNQITETYDCLFKLDDDTIIPDDYIETLEPFITHSNFGCVSGKILSLDKGKFIEEKRVNDYSIGTGMLIKRKVIKYLNGYPVIAGSDTLINLTSKYLGYQNQQLNHIELKQLRLTCENAKMDRAMATAIKQYYLRYPFWIIYLNFLRHYKTNFRLKWKEYKTFVSKIKEEERLNDKKLINYNKQRLFMVIFKDLKKKWFK
jgi:hypothetical protein